MKIRAFLLLFAMSVMFIACGEKEGTPETNGTETDMEQSDSDMMEYTSEEGGFKVMLPEEPETGATQVPTEVGEIEMRTWIVDKTSYGIFIATADYPQEVIDAQEDKEMFLANGRDGAINSMNGELKNETDIELDGYPGKEFVAEGQKDGRTVVLHAKVFLVGNRLYQTFVMSEKGDEPEEITEQFLSSFELLK